VQTSHQDSGEQRDLQQNRESLTLSVAAEASNLLASHSCPKKMKETLCSSTKSPRCLAQIPLCLPTRKA